MKSNTGLVVGVPTRGAVSIDWMSYMMELLNYMPNGLKWHFYYVRGKPVDVAREMIVDHALECGARHLLFMDDDTYAPQNAVLRLWNARKPIISGVVYSKSDPSMPMVFREDGAGPWVEIIAAPKTLYKVASTGLAMTLISAEVLRKLAKPRFKWTSIDDGDGGTVRMGEDTFLFEQVRKAGFQAWVDSAVMCLHGEMTIEADGKCSTKFYPSKEQTAEYLELYSNRAPEPPAPAPKAETPAPVATPRAAPANGPAATGEAKSGTTETPPTPPS